MAVPSRSSPAPRRRVRARNFISPCPRTQFVRMKGMASPPQLLLPGGCRAAKSAPMSAHDFVRSEVAERTILPEAPVAQLDRALDYESRGREFESLRARQIYQ